MTTCMDKFALYSKSVDQKIDDFLKTPPGNRRTEEARLARAYKEAHVRIAACVMQENLFPWEELDLKGLLPYCSVEDLGLVRRTGERFEFIESNYAEFFYCKHLLKLLETGRMDGKFLATVFRDGKYSGVLRFCDDAMNDILIRDSVRKAGFDNWCAADVLEGAVEKASLGDPSGTKLLSILLEGVCTFADFDRQVTRRPEYHWESTAALKLFITCMTDDVCREMFDSDAVRTWRFVEIAFEFCEFETLSHLLEKLRRGRSSRREDATGSGMRLLDARSQDGRNILFPAARNGDVRVLMESIRFYGDVFGKEDAKRLLLDRQTDVVIGRVERSLDENLAEMLEVIRSASDTETVLALLDRTNNIVGLKYVHLFALFRCPSQFDEFVEWLIRSFGGRFPDRLRFESDRWGRTIWHDMTRLSPDFGVACGNVERWWHLFNAGEDIRQSVTKCCIQGNTVFHSRPITSSTPLRDLNGLQGILGREGFVELMTRENDHRSNCLHLSFADVPKETVVDDLNFVGEFLDGRALSDFLTAKDGCGNTLLHCLASRHPRKRVDGHELKVILTRMQDVLGEYNFRNLLKTRNSRGRRVSIVNDGDEFYLIS